jgi:hypothetical protein
MRNVSMDTFLKSWVSLTWKQWLARSIIEVNWLLLLECHVYDRAKIKATLYSAAWLQRRFALNRKPDCKNHRPLVTWKMVLFWKPGQHLDPYITWTSIGEASLFVLTCCGHLKNDWYLMGYRVHS